MNRRSVLQSVLAIPAMLAGKVFASPSAGKPDAMTRISEKITTARAEVGGTDGLVVTISRQILSELQWESPSPKPESIVAPQVGGICGCPVRLTSDLANGFIVSDIAWPAEPSERAHYRWVGE